MLMANDLELLHDPVLPASGKEGNYIIIPNNKSLVCTSHNIPYPKILSHFYYHFHYLDAA